MSANNRLIPWALGMYGMSLPYVLAHRAKKQNLSTDQVKDLAAKGRAEIDLMHKKYFAGDPDWMSDGLKAAIEAEEQTPEKKRYRAIQASDQTWHVNVLGDHKTYEISFVHKDFEHGFISFGWESHAGEKREKVIFAKGTASPALFKAAIAEAKRVCADPEALAVYIR